MKGRATEEVSGAKPEANSVDSGATGSAPAEVLIGQLRRTLGRMEVAFGLLDEAACITDGAGRVQWCNGAFCRLVGRKQFRILGQPAAGLLPLSSQGKLLVGDEHPVSRLLASPDMGSQRGRFELDRSGAVRTLEVYCSRHGADGEQVSKLASGSVVVLVRDITESVLAEQWLEQMNARAELLRCVAAAANEAESPEAALGRALDRLCRHIGWPVGHVFPVEEPGRRGEGNEALIRPAGCSYLADPVRFGPFRLESEASQFRPGEGIPGATYAKGAPRWFATDCADRRFRPGAAGQRAGLRTVFGFPILAGRSVAAVMELCTDREVEPDPELEELAAEIGTQLGRTIERRRAALDLLRSKEELERRVGERTADLSALNAALMQEVAERQQVESALRETVTRHRDLVQSVRDVMFAVTPAGRAESLNPAFEKLTARSAADWTGKRLLVLVHPEDRRRVVESFRAAARGGSPPSAEMRISTGDGGWVSVECSLAPRRATGRITGVLGIARDITERRCAEQQLRVQQRAMESTSEGIFLIDACAAGHPVAYANAALEHIMGFPAGAVLGNSWKRLFDPAPEASLLSLEAAIDALHACTEEIAARRRDGSPYWFRVALTPVLDAAGSPTHFVGIVSDISQQKEAERMKNDLVATVSHELRTPLTSLRGFAELMLQREYPPEKQKKFLGIIDKEATRLANLINDFLDVQRIESGRQVYNFDRVDITVLLKEAAALFRGSSATHEFVLEAASGVFVLADAERIRQVLANLVSNAVKFSPHGGAVELGVAERGGFAHCSVSDEGIGIPPEGLTKLFQKFYRVDNTETRKIGGTGLGLALVKQIVEAHKGEVQVESAPGKGSTFTFTLPLV